MKDLQIYTYLTHMLVVTVLWEAKWKLITIFYEKGCPL